MRASRGPSPDGIARLRLAAELAARRAALGMRLQVVACLAGLYMTYTGQAREAPLTPPNLLGVRKNDRTDVATAISI